MFWLDKKQRYYYAKCRTWLTLQQSASFTIITVNYIQLANLEHPVHWAVSFFEKIDFSTKKDVIDHGEQECMYTQTLFFWLVYINSKYDFLGKVMETSYFIIYLRAQAIG